MSFPFGVAGGIGSLGWRWCGGSGGGGGGGCSVGVPGAGLGLGRVPVVCSCRGVFVGWWFVSVGCVCLWRGWGGVVCMSHTESFERLAIQGLSCYSTSVILYLWFRS